MVLEGSEHGEIEEGEKDIIERVFHLGDRNITSLMTHRTDIVWFNINQTIDDIKKQEELAFSTYPVCEETVDNIKGLISIKDLFRAPDGTPLHQLAKPALFVPENNKAYQLLEKFKSTKIQLRYKKKPYKKAVGGVKK